MEKISEVELAWFCGLFEGEGSFHISRGIAKGLQISMTDLDVLEKVQALLGGALSPATRREGKDHWKDAWRWSLSSGPTYLLIPRMIPHLGARRRARAEEAMRMLGVVVGKRDAEKERVVKLKLDVVAMNNSGSYTQSEIASNFGIDRTYVNKILAAVK